MRSSKNRSRSKGNRNRSVGNIVNRVFDSSGPEGKVRGTPQQIIDKYNQLARDAQLSNDRVAAENFQQHAEHYLRLLGEAQREQEARQQQQGNQQGGGNQGGNQDGGQQGERHGGGQQGERQGGNQSGDRQQNDRQQNDRQGNDRQGNANERGAQPDRETESGGESRSFDAVGDNADDNQSTLVETPESSAKPKRSRTRRPKKTDGESGGDDGSGGKDGGGSSREAAE